MTLFRPQRDAALRSRLLEYTPADMQSRFSMLTICTQQTSAKSAVTNSTK